MEDGLFTLRRGLDSDGCPGENQIQTIIEVRELVTTYIYRRFQIKPEKAAATYSKAKSKFCASFDRRCIEM